MKDAIRFSVLISVLTLTILGCGTNIEDEERVPDPVEFVSADPPAGSTVLSNATLTVLFSGVPKQLSVMQGTVSRSVRTATISGPFTVGELNLTLTWEDGTHTLVYTVEPVPVKFISVDPPNGSLLRPDAAITVSFDGEPKHLRVTPWEVSVSDRIATISGPFPRGALDLTMEWDTGTHALAYTVEFRVPEKMVLILESEFEMGSNADAANADERPVHTVYVEAFYMDIYEVTVGEYRAFVQETGHRAPDWDQVSLYSPTDEHPIVFVSWHDAMAYAKWKGKRLPTEAEWEKAARGDAIQQSYPWGDTAPDGKQCNFADKNLGHYWWADKEIDDGYMHAAPVGTYPDNEYGLHDMTGNVWEWCLDAYDPDFYAVSPGANPVSGIDTIKDIVDTFLSVQSPRVLRSGSWLVTARSVRSAARFRLDPASVSDNVGFRCVMDLDVLE